ncbi:hypothetical protein BS17DRAFT_763946 [Gyrodon lividus]|nr:hypothetical protein BS17DRAFT_763946 [Gyrodon lividus]
MAFFANFMGGKKKKKNLPDEISKVTDEDIKERVRIRGWNPETIYISQRKAVLQETIQEVVKYVMFSHRWDVAGEPTYQDVFSGKQRNIAGFKKLTQFCKTAKSQGYRIAWSDTCCIDKTNTAELSEAIHAMFKWYSHSHLCIIHLAESSSYSDFDHESWFTRGWTLQELLAPTRVKFYNKNWQPLTTTAITNDKQDKGGDCRGQQKGVKRRGVWEIMSWASARKTTRIEDIAYCLIGLFDVNLTITYGEGDKAFPRLVEAIMAKKPKWDVLAWTGQASLTHPAIPSSPACYSRFDARMVHGDAGMRDFSMTPRGLLLTSLPLIAMEFDSTSEDVAGIHTVTLKPRSNTDFRWLGTYSNVMVTCGQSRLRLIRTAEDLSICILNFQPAKGSKRGKLKVGREYVCFLLYSEEQDGGESTWMKFTADNSLRVSCMSKPEIATERTNTLSSDFSRERIPETAEEGVFALPLEATCIRSPAAP